MDFNLAAESGRSMKQSEVSQFGDGRLTSKLRGENDQKGRYSSLIFGRWCDVSSCRPSFSQNTCAISKLESMIFQRMKTLEFERLSDMKVTVIGTCSNCWPKTIRFDRLSSLAWQRYSADRKLPNPTEIRRKFFSKFCSSPSHVLNGRERSSTSKINLLKDIY